MGAGGQEKETDYKYTARDGSCKFSAAKVLAKISNEVNITFGDESDKGLPAAVALTPTSICYQVASDFRNYKSGVYTSIFVRMVKKMSIMLSLLLVMIQIL